MSHFRIKPALQLQKFTDMVEGIVLSPPRLKQEWTTESLHEYIRSLGFDVTLDEVTKVNDELHTRGIVEDIPD